MPPSLKTSAALLESLRPVRQRLICPRCSASLQRNRAASYDTPLRRSVSTAPPQRSEMEVTADRPSPPRWSQTPPAMRAPVRSRIKPQATVHNHKISHDPKKLDDMYNNFLGSGGDQMLREETKWLAITHKSFDHGMRGFNDRLAFLGKRIVDLQTSLGLLAASDSARFLQDQAQDPWGRKPFQHPALDSIECLSGNSRHKLLHHKELSRLSARFGIPEVVRWWPKMVRSCL